MSTEHPDPREADDEAARLFGKAADAVDAALKAAPNWRDSRYVTEDIQRAAAISRDLRLLETATPPTERTR